MSRRVIVWALVGVLAVMWLAGVLVEATEDDPTPIGEQSCAELADTFADITWVLRDRDASNEDIARASQRARALNRRVDRLGGCPEEPDLQ